MGRKKAEKAVIFRFPAAVLPMSVVQLQRAREAEHGRRRQLEAAMQPELIAWLESNPDRAAAFTEEEIDELFSLFGTGGPLTKEGVEHFAAQIERRRQLLDKVRTITASNLAEKFEALVQLFFDLLQPYRDSRQDRRDGS